MRLPIRIVLLFANIVAVVALLLANLALVLRPEKAILPALLGLGYEWIVLIVILFLILWLFTHHKLYALLSLCALLVSYHPLRNTIRLSNDRIGETTHSLKVMTYNTARMDGVAKPQQNDVLQFLLKQDADVLCLQEFETNKQEKHLTLNEVKTTLKDKYPYSYIDFKIYKNKRQYGLAVFSRYPLTNKKTIHYKSLANQSDFCDIIVNQDTLRLCNNHLESYRLNNEDLSVVDIRSNQERSITSTVGKMRDGYAYRSEEARQVADELKQSPYPAIVCGDLNDVPVSYAYHHLRGNMEDAFLDGSPWSLGHTYLHHWWGLRIDHIFHSSSLKVKESRVLPAGASDHHPVTATFVW